MLGIRAARTTDIVRIAHETGHHAILVDLEHSTMGLDVAAALCATAGDLGLTALVRVPEREYGDIGRLLDCGAHGIVAPRIETADEAHDRRPCLPLPSSRSALPGLQRASPRHAPDSGGGAEPGARRTTVVQVLIETPTGVEQRRRRSPRSTASTWSPSAPTT